MRTPIRRIELLAGSVSQRVVHGAHCPVVIVPADRSSPD
jgi:nucleotide-binding universal stress UspA family protein